MGVTLERVQFKFASIIGELCSEPDVLSQFAVWVDLRLAEYKLKGSISLDCSGDTPDPVWLQGILSVLLAKKLAKQRAVPKPSGHSYGHSPENFARIRSPSYKSHRPTATVNLEETPVNVKEEPYDDSVYPMGLPAQNIADRHRKRSAAVGENDSDRSNILYSHSMPKQRRSENNGNPSTESLMSIIGDGDDVENNSSLQYDSLNDTAGSGVNSEEAANTSLEVVTVSDSQYADQSSTSFDRVHTSSNLAGELPKVKGQGQYSVGDPGGEGQHSVYRPHSKGKQEYERRSKTQTSKNVSSAVGIFKRWFRRRHPGDPRLVEAIPPAELDLILADFFTTVKKASGGEYIAHSFDTLRTSLEHHLRHSSYPMSITRSNEFKFSQEAFSIRKVQLRASANVAAALREFDEPSLLTPATVELDPSLTAGFADLN